jgi:hypothetical protein
MGRRACKVIFVEKAKGKGPLGRPRRKWVTLKWILNIYYGRLRTEFIWLRIGTRGRLL